MASTYSPTLRTELPATGDQNDAWAATVDNNLDVPIEEGLAGIATINVPDANVTLTTANALTDQARMPVLVFTGALTAQRTIIAPQVPKVYIVRNNTTGGQNLVMRTAASITLVTDTGIPQPYSATTYSGSSTASIPVPGVVIPPDSTAYVYTDGTLFDYCVNSLPAAAAADSVVLSSPLPIDDGGTGATTQSAARSNLGLGSAALLDADTASTINTVPLRDSSASFSAGIITAGLAGLAAESTTTNLLANLPPTSYSQTDTDWAYDVFIPLSVPALTVVNMVGIAGSGPYLISWGASGSSYLQGFFAIPDGTTAPLGSNLPTLIGQNFQLPLFASMTGVYKLRKIY